MIALAKNFKATILAGELFVTLGSRTQIRGGKVQTKLKNLAKFRYLAEFWVPFQPNQTCFSKVWFWLNRKRIYTIFHIGQNLTRNFAKLSSSKVEYQLELSLAQFSPSLFCQLSYVQNLYEEQILEASPKNHEPKEEDNLKNIDNLNERRPKILLQLHILTC